MLYFKPIFKLCFRMTKCTFHKFGTSGNIEKHDALCILPLNIGNVFSYCAQFQCFSLSPTMSSEHRLTFLHPPGQYRLLPEEGSTQWNHPLCSQRKDLHLHIDLFPLPIFTVIAFSAGKINQKCGGAGEGSCIMRLGD